MSATSNGAACRSKCWIWAAISGAIIFLVMLIGGYSFIASLVIGIIAAVLIGFLLIWLLCGSTVPAEPPAARAAPPATGPTGTPLPDAAAAAPVAATPAAKAEPAPEPTPAPAAAAKPDPAPAPAAKPAADDKDYDGDGVVEGTGEGTRPAALDGPRGGAADDLKKIKGVGPKLEQLLFSLGFYHFDQIAGWSGDEVAWVDANLKGFKGRVSRDNWVEQARLLAEGGETEFSKKVDKGGVY